MIHGIHISERFNKNSILKNGLIPSKISLDHHLRFFRDFNYLNDTEDKMLYMWLDSEKNEKFIKDMVYCKVWLAPRNKLNCVSESDIGYEDYFDYSFVDTKELYPYTNMIYDVYKIMNPNYSNSLHDIHAQEPNDSKYNSCYQMDEDYAHDDKVLLLSKNIEKNIQIIGQVQLDILKNNKIIIKIKGGI